MTARLAIVTLALAWATAPLPAAAEATCQGRLGGAAKGTFECAVRVKDLDKETAAFDIRALKAIEGLAACVPGSFQVPKPLKAGTWTLDTLGQGLASVAIEEGYLYTAAKSSTQRGEVTFTITRVERGPAGAPVIHGTYRARLLPAGGGKKGEVTVDVTF